VLATALLELEVHNQGTTRLVTLTGEVDIATVDRAYAVLHEAFDGQAETVVLDLSPVTFMDSGGLHLVLDATRAAAARDVRFVVLPGPPDVRRVFDLADVADRVPFARTSGRFAHGAQA
jgi:anti-anti-sigma factor